MLDVYVITLALAVGLALFASAACVGVLRALGQVSFLRRTIGAGERTRWGGAVVFLTFALVPFIASAISDQAAEFFAPKSAHFVEFLLACTLVFAIGFVDDIRALPWKTKLLGQVAAASAVYAAGYSIDSVGLPWGGDFALGPMAPVVTVLWIIFFTNAINLIDGRDGVAAGVAVLAAAALAQVAASAGHPTVALLLIAAAGAGLGLLPFNLPPASVYLGDSGALLLGFILGSLSIRASTGVSDAVFIAVPIVALGFPIADTLLAVVRRALDHRHPLLGDLDHIHHRLEVAGFGPRGLVVVIYAVSALFAGGALLLHHVRIFPAEVAVLLGTVVIVGVILTKLGYLLSLWNSASLVWLREQLRRVAPVPVVASDSERD